MFGRLTLRFAIPLTALVAIDWWFAIFFDTDAPQSVSVIGAGLISFALAYSWGREGSGANTSNESALRSAIACAIVVQYLTLVSIVAFFSSAPENQRLPAITQTLISSFTTIVGVVIAFYFGASAYVQAHVRRSRNGIVEEKRGR